MSAVQDVFCLDRCKGCGAPGPLLCGPCFAGASRSENPVGREEGARILTALAYEGPARSLVLDLKLRGRRTAAVPLVDALVELVHREGLDGEVVAWVPGRRADIRRRGFDHAHLLALGVARALGLPARRLLWRAGRRRDQAGLGRDDRWLNAAGSFRGGPSKVPVVVVDDLVTSGATASAAVSALTTVGVPSVEILAACRAERASTGLPGGSSSL